MNYTSGSVGRMRNHDNILEEIWDSWEPHLKDDANRLDYKFCRIIEETKVERIPEEKSIKFLNKRFIELIVYIAAHRETDKQQARRQLETARKRERNRLAYIDRPKSKTSQKR